MLAGVTLKDPARFDLRGDLSCGEDVSMDINVIIEGDVSIGSGSVIGPNVILKNVTIGENTKILANSMKGSTLLRVPNAGHGANEQEAGLINKAIEENIRRGLLFTSSKSVLEEPLRSSRRSRL